MSFDDQYDTPLTGPERARIEALNQTRDRLYDTAEKWVDAAKVLERFIIGGRADAVKEQINAAYASADQLLRDGDKATLDSGGDPWTGAPDVVTVDRTKLRELVRVLSRIADGPPF